MQEFYYQKQQLQDALTEQEKDLKLFEQICKSLLSEKDLKRLIEKSRWSEDDDEWILPYMKRKSLDSVMSAQSGGKMLPDIFAGQPKYNPLEEVSGNSNFGGDQLAIVGLSASIPTAGGSLSARAPSRGGAGKISRPSSSAYGESHSSNAPVPMLMLSSGIAGGPPTGNRMVDGIGSAAVPKKKKKGKKKVKAPAAEKVASSVCLWHVNDRCESLL